MRAEIWTKTHSSLSNLLRMTGLIESSSVSVRNCIHSMWLAVLIGGQGGANQRIMLRKRHFETVLLCARTAEGSF